MGDIATQQQRIELKRKYPIELDSKIRSLSVQYAFKPVNLDASKSGTLSVTDSGEATVELSKFDNTIETFKGVCQNSSISGQDHEYLLILENEKFRLVKVDTLVTNLRPTRADVKSTQNVVESINVVKELKKRADGVKKRKLADESVSSSQTVIQSTIQSPVIREVKDATKEEEESTEALFEAMFNEI